MKRRFIAGTAQKQQAPTGGACENRTTSKLPGLRGGAPRVVLLTLPMILISLQSSVY